jgi:membrane protein DedA with SNARE-associated domain
MTAILQIEMHFYLYNSTSLFYISLTTYEFLLSNFDKKKKKMIITIVVVVVVVVVVVWPVRKRKKSHK